MGGHGVDDGLHPHDLPVVDLHPLRQAELTEGQLADDVRQ